MKPLPHLLCFYLIGTAAVSAATLTFDDLHNVQIPTGYGGLQWSGFRALSSAESGPTSSFRLADVSPNIVVADTDGRFGQISSPTPFNLNSAYLTGAYHDGLQVEVQGFLGSALIYDRTFTVNASGPAFVEFDYQGIDLAKFIPSGGTEHPGYTLTTVDSFDFAMDNLSITVPDGGATGLLLGLTFAGLALARKSFAR